VRAIGRGAKLQTAVTEAGFDSSVGSCAIATEATWCGSGFGPRASARIADALSMLRRLGYDSGVVAQMSSLMTTSPSVRSYACRDN